MTADRYELPVSHLTRRLRPILTRPPKWTVSEWADRRRFLSRESSSQPGKYRSSVAPYQREPMDSANDPTVQSTCLMWASQVTGKTECLNNVAGYFIDVDPAPILFVEPTKDMAESWSKDRLSPMLRDCPCFRGKVRDPRTRDSGNTITNKLYLGGDIAIVGANSPSGLAMRPRRVVILDEIDRYPPSAGSEGDPCLLAIRRTESFWNAVIFMASSPTTKGASRIEKEFEQSDKREWWCPCPECGQHQVLKWRQVLWGKSRVQSLVDHGRITAEAGKLAAETVPTDGSDAVLECEHCAAHLNDAQRVKMVRAGEWRPSAPFRGKRGYWLNGICSPFRHKKGYASGLHQMAAQAKEAAAGGIETLKTWTNTFLAETWEEKGARVEPHSIMTRAENYTPAKLPAEIILLLAAVDVQKTWLQVEVIGLGMDDETWGVEFLSIRGDPEQGEVWSDLGDTLSRTFTREDGQALTITATAIDMRHKPTRVREFVRRGGIARVYPVYGVAGGQTMLVTHRFNKVYALRTFAVDTKMAKDSIFARLNIQTPGPRYMHFPTGSGYNEEYYAQLTGECLKTHFLHGFPKQTYEKIRERNEALDLRVYFLAAVDILKPNMTAIAKRQGKLTAAPATTTATAPTEPVKTYVLNPRPTSISDQPSLPPPTRIDLGRPAPRQPQRIRVGRW